MERRYQIAQTDFLVTYGETFANLLKVQEAPSARLLFIGNQRYYELYADKISGLFPNAVSQDWFICGNQRYCNELAVLEELLLFSERFSPEEPCLLIGLGNEGVMELSAFFHRTSVLQTALWLLPVSLRALAKTLEEHALIVKAPQQTGLLRAAMAPQRVLFDQTLAERQLEGRLVDFLTLIRCGILEDYGFLKELLQNFPSQSSLQQRSFTGLIETLIDYYEADRTVIQAFGKTFTQAFYQIENGHLLSQPMKRFFGLLFQLLWCQARTGFAFNQRLLFQWLQILGFPIELPESLSLGDYGQQVIRLAQRQGPLTLLKKVGQVQGTGYPTETELTAAFTAYQQIIREIRGETDDI